MALYAAPAAWTFQSWTSDHLRFNFLESFKSGFYFLIHPDDSHIQRGKPKTPEVSRPSWVMGLFSLLSGFDLIHIIKDDWERMQWDHVRDWKVLPTGIVIWSMFHAWPPEGLKGGLRYFKENSSLEAEGISCKISQSMFSCAGELTPQRN